METKFTRGPWTLETVATNGGKGSCHKIGNFPVSSSFQKQNYACVYADGVRIGIDESNPVAKELIANAHLIAAAPDMYEAIETWLQSYGSTSMVSNKFRRVLKKARGEL